MIYPQINARVFTFVHIILYFVPSFIHRKYELYIKHNILNNISQINMNTKRRKVNLGFTDQIFEEGIHICQIFSEDDERHDSLIDFVVSGINDGDRTTCFTEKENDDILTAEFTKHGLDYSQLVETGKFSLSPTEEVYFKGGTFDPERMLALMQDYYETSIADKYIGARVIGEMSPKVETIEGGSRLLEYESRISMLLRKCPLTAVCQYDARKFDGATIMDILKVHPFTILKGKVVHNPFFIEPEEYLKSKA